jgi:oligopeptide transport system permease protein
MPTVIESQGLQSSAERTSTESAGTRRPSASLWADAWQRLKRNRAAIVSVVVLAIILLLAVMGPLVWPYPFDKQTLSASNQQPSLAHPLGTDRLGRDNVARLLVGARVSMTVAFVAQFVIVLIGLPAGLLAGYFGGWVDNLVMRLAEILYSIPVLLLIILIMTVLRDVLDTGTGPVVGALARIDSAAGGLLGTIIGLCVIAWIVVARLLRGEVLRLKERDFISAARCVGVPNSRIMWRHLLPNALSPVIVAVAYGIPEAIFLEAALSFMGLGVRPPMASWGLMISEGSRAIQSYPYMVWPPALALALTMICFTFLGDGLRDALDPRMKR